MESSWQQITDAARMISLPEAYLRLKQVLDDPDFSLAEVALVIGQDPALTARLLRLVNSSLYGYVSKIETIGRAVSLLGTQQIHDLVLATAVAHTFSGMSSDLMDMRRFWQTSLYRAIACRRMAAMSGTEEQRERLFVVGLLCDIGHLVMYQTVPAQCAQAMQLAREEAAPLHQAERALLGYDYAMLGSYLMEQWHLPEALCTTTRYHVAPSSRHSHAAETAFVHLAVLMAGVLSEGGTATELDEQLQTVAQQVWELAGLNADDCLQLVPEIVTEVEETTRIMLA